MGNFKKGVSELVKKGYPKDYAAAVMYKAGVAKYGKKGMEKKALAAKNKKRP